MEGKDFFYPVQNAQRRGRIYMPRRGGGILLQCNFIIGGDRCFGDRSGPITCFPSRGKGFHPGVSHGTFDGVRSQKKRVARLAQPSRPVPCHRNGMQRRVTCGMGPEGHRHAFRHRRSGGAKESLHPTPFWQSVRCALPTGRGYSPRHRC